MTEQLTLTPEKPPVFVDERIPLEELPDDEQLIGPPPDKALVDSIRRYGIIDPIIIEDIERGDGVCFYQVTDGRRRVKAARLAGLEQVPARIYDYGDDEGWMPSALTVMTHATRRDNPVCEYIAIRKLIEDHSEQEVARATGLGIPKVRRLMQFHNLDAALLEAAAEGGIAPGVAAQAAKLPKDRQASLAHIYADTGKLTGKDVAEAKQVRREQAAAAISFDAINAVPDITSDTTEDGDGPRAEFHKAVVELIETWDASASLNDLTPVVERLKDAFKQASLEGIV